MHLVKKWLKKLKEAQDKKWYEDGFCWAMAAYYLKSMSQDEIADQIANPPDAFDKGALYALRILP
ncbi:MAG: hypothetical protein RBT25_11950 [Lentisphaeria bacterium]|nr:hypothetical protein [Lentisphaeria bacterium]